MRFIQQIAPIFYVAALKNCRMLFRFLQFCQTPLDGYGAPMFC